MTKKHFNAIAAALKAERPGENWNANKHAQWDNDVRAMARVCRSFNPLFDVGPFIEACGGLFWAVEV